MGVVKLASLSDLNRYGPGAPPPEDRPWNAARRGRNPLPNPPAHMEVRQVSYTLPPLEQRQKLRREFNKIARPAFLQWLAQNHRPALRKLGIEDAEIDQMVVDGHAPEGYNVHHRLPLGGGGDNSLQNLVFIAEDPHVDLHRFLEPQLKEIQEGEVRQVWLPIPNHPVHPVKAVPKPRLMLPPPDPNADDPNAPAANTPDKAPAIPPGKAARRPARPAPRP